MVGMIAWFCIDDGVLEFGVLKTLDRGHDMGIVHK